MKRQEYYELDDWDKTEDEIMRTEHEWFLESWNQWGRQDLIFNIESAMASLTGSDIFMDYLDAETSDKLLKDILSTYNSATNGNFNYIVESSGVIIFIPDKGWLLDNFHLIKETLAKLTPFLIATDEDTLLYANLVMGD